MIEILLAALMGLMRTASGAVIAIITASVIMESTATGITLAVALALYSYASRVISKIDDVQDVADAEGGEDEY